MDKKSFQLEKVIVILLVVQVLLSLVMVYHLNIVSDAVQGDLPAPSAAQPSAAPSGGVVNIDTTGDAFKGDADAPVEIIEFSDFQCPFCQRWYQQTLPDIEENYIATGKVKIVYKHFPLNNIHPQAQKAAEAAECANDQGMFWEYHDVLFDNIQSLSASNYKMWAADLGLDTDAFNSCLDGNKYAAKVSADLAAGQAAGVTGTPSFFVNGVKISGAQPYSVFEAAIEEALN